MGEGFCHRLNLNPKPLRSGGDNLPLMISKMELQFTCVIECAPDDPVNPHHLCDEIQSYLDSVDENTAQVTKYRLEKDNHISYYPS